MNPIALQAQGLSFDYGRKKVLDSVDLQLCNGELLALLGINGAGKSTLLRLLLGFERPRQGQILLGTRLLHRYRRRELARMIAYVPQAHTAPFPYTVSEVVLLGRIAQAGFLKPPSTQDRRVAETAIAQLGIAPLADRPYTTLSGGEQQLTLIARALAQEARILILDEPSSALDYGNQIRLLGKLRELADSGYALLFTTHHPEHVQLAADRVALLIDGRIHAAGSPAEILNPPMLKRLYGVDVEWLNCADGQAAFWPCLRPECSNSKHTLTPNPSPQMGEGSFEKPLRGFEDQSPETAHV